MKTKSVQNNLLVMKDRLAGKLMLLKLWVSAQIMMMPVTIAYAGGETDSNGSGSNEAMTVILSIIGVVIKLFPAIGIILVMIGAYKLFMAFRNDQPDAYSGAAKDIVIGIVLIVFETFVWDKISGQLTGGTSATS